MPRNGSTSKKQKEQFVLGDADKRVDVSLFGTDDDDVTPRANNSARKSTRTVSPSVATVPRSQLPTQEISDEQAALFMMDDPPAAGVHTAARPRQQHGAFAVPAAPGATAARAATTAGVRGGDDFVLHVPTSRGSGGVIAPYAAEGQTATRPLLFAPPEQQPHPPHPPAPRRAAPAATTATTTGTARRQRSPSHERFASSSFVTPANNAGAARRRNNNSNAAAAAARNDDWLNSSGLAMIGAGVVLGDGQMPSSFDGDDDERESGGINNETYQSLTDEHGAPLTVTQHSQLELREGIQMPSPLPFFSQDMLEASSQRRRVGASQPRGAAAAPLSQHVPNAQQCRSAKEWCSSARDFFSFIDARPLKLAK